jgi:hypothetical protein
MEEPMNEQSNIPMSSEPAGFAGWISTWIMAVTKPNEQTFATLAEHPDAMSNSRAFTWVFLAGTVSAIVSGLLGAIAQVAGFAPQTPGLAELFGGNANRGVGFALGLSICSSPVVGALGVLFFAIGVGVIQWVAKMFKGTGTFSQLAYVMAAVSVPFTLVSSILTPFNSIPFVGLCFSGLSGLLGIYALVLEIMAVKGVNKFDWGQAAGSVLLPGLLLICCAVVFISSMAAMGLAIGDTFKNLAP